MAACHYQRHFPFHARLGRTAPDVRARRSNGDLERRQHYLHSAKRGGTAPVGAAKRSGRELTRELSDRHRPRDNLARGSERRDLRQHPPGTAALGLGRGVQLLPEDRPGARRDPANENERTRRTAAREPAQRWRMGNHDGQRERFAGDCASRGRARLHQPVDFRSGGAQGGDVAFVAPTGRRFVAFRKRHLRHARVGDHLGLHLAAHRPRSPGRYRHYGDGRHSRATSP